MVAPLTIVRMVKTSGVMTSADGADAYVSPKKFNNVKKLNVAVTPIPGEQHLGIPIGPEAREIQVEFAWNMANPPCAGKTYVQSLKNWTCNSIYYLAASGSLVNDLVSAGYYLAKNITTTREAKTGRAGNYDRWEVTTNFIKLRDTDITDCPDFEDTTTSNPDVSGITTPGLTLVNTTAATESIEIKPTKIVVRHTGAIEAFPLYDEEAFTVLPPLGNTGPIIEIEAWVSSATAYQTVMNWAATRSTMVAATQHMYPEFDNDNAPTYYSRWIVSNINVGRDIASGAGLANGVIQRKLAMTLTRYWRYEMIEV